MKITFVETLFPDGIAGKKIAGSANWDANKSHIRFICPCGCGGYIDLPVKSMCPEGWDWDGNVDEPTLSPSILNRPCGWHGYLRKGEWVTA